MKSHNVCYVREALWYHLRNATVEFNPAEIWTLVK